MAKRKTTTEDGLPYFKFSVAKWLAGDISECSLSAQGLFMNICVRYWMKRGTLSLSKTQKAFPRKSKLFSELSDAGILKCQGDDIVISFLDEQLTELGAVSSQNRKNAETRWNPTKDDATALPSHSERSATAMPREEKRREEIRKEEKENTPAEISLPLSVSPWYAQPGKPEYSEYESWARAVAAGEDPYFDSMLKNEALKINGAIVDHTKSYLVLLAEYPKKAPPDQHRFRIALIGHIKEKIQKNERSKTGTGTISPEAGKDYRSAGGF